MELPDPSDPPQGGSQPGGSQHGGGPSGGSPSGDPSPAGRAADLMAEAKAAAFEHTRVVDAALRDMIARAVEIAEGGDVYPSGVRDLCERLAAEAEQRRQLLEALATRALAPGGPSRIGLEGM